MTAPTEPGFYWAKMAAYCRHGVDVPAWFPVSVWMNETRGTHVELPGVGGYYREADVLEWGQRIEAPDGR